MRQLRTHAQLFYLAIGFGLIMAMIIRAPVLPITYAQDYPGQTSTALALTAIAASTPTPTPTPTPIATTVVGQPTPTLTVLPTFEPNPTLTPVPQAPLPPTVEPNPLPNAAAGPLICAPSIPIIIQGKATPRAGILLYFARRAVSGTVADANGVFRITLNVGNERPGIYTISVYMRGSWQEIIRTTCIVPAVGG